MAFILWGRSVQRRLLLSMRMEVLVDGLALLLMRMEAGQSLALGRRLVSSNWRRGSTCPRHAWCFVWGLRMGRVPIRWLCVHRRRMARVRGTSCRGRVLGMSRLVPRRLERKTRRIVRNVPLPLADIALIAGFAWVVVRLVTSPRRALVAKVRMVRVGSVQISSG